MPRGTAEDGESFAGSEFNSIGVLAFMELRRAAIEINFSAPLAVFRWKSDLYKSITATEGPESLLNEEPFLLKLTDIKAIVRIDPKRIVLQFEGILDPDKIAGDLESLFLQLGQLGPLGWGKLSVRLSWVQSFDGKFGELVAKIKERVYRSDLPFLERSFDAGIYLTLRDAQAVVNFVFGPFPLDQLKSNFAFPEEHFPDPSIFLEVNHSKTETVEVSPKEIRATIRHALAYGNARVLEANNLGIWQQQP